MEKCVEDAWSNPKQSNAASIAINCIGSVWLKITLYVQM